MRVLRETGLAEEQREETSRVGWEKHQVGKSFKSFTKLLRLRDNFFLKIRTEEQLQLGAFQNVSHLSGAQIQLERSKFIALFQLNYIWTMTYGLVKCHGLCLTGWKY